MIDLLRLYLAASLSGLALLPLVRRACPRLPDRGHGIARILGLAAGAWISFLLASAARRPLGSPIALGGLGLLGALAWGGPVCRTLRSRRAPGQAPRRPRLESAGAMLGVEILTLAGLVLFFLIARHNPAVDPDSERFMDYAFLKAYLRSPGLPIEDPWFAGQPIDYYHFGYALLAFLLRAGGVGPARGIVPAIALLHALLWSAACSAGLALTGRLRGGYLAAFLVLGAGNFEWIRQVGAVASGRAFDWFASSRVIAGAIDEFPWFSLLWGDPHPYVVALPIFLAGVTLLVATLPGTPGSPEEVPSGAGEERARWGALAACLALVTGALLVTHPWDLPILLLVFCLLFATAGGGRPRAATLVAGLAAGSIAFGPFLRGVRQGGRVLALVPRSSGVGEWALAFGPFILLAVLGIVVLAAGRGGPRRRPDRAREALALAAGGLLAALMCEVVYVRDFFASTDLARMNTVFKVHRLSWALFGVAAPVLATRLEALRPAIRRAGRAGFALALAGAAVYPVLGTRAWLAFRSARAREARAGGAAGAAEPGAAADELFGALRPGDAAAAAYLEAHAAPGDVVLEETGEAYTWSSRIATFSGVPTVLGWGNHEAGWRDDWTPILARQAEIESLYRDPLSERSRTLRLSLGVRWVVVGAGERSRYGDEGPDRMERLGERVLEREGTALFRVAGTVSR